MFNSTQLNSTLTRTIAALALVCATASAQAGSLFVTSSFSSSESLIFTPATTTVNNVEAFWVQVLGKLNGGTVFDQIFALPVGNPTVQAAFASAQQTISNLGGLGVTIGVPQLTSSSSSTSSSITTLYSLAALQDVTGPGVVTFGPATLSVGAFTSCNVASLPATTKPACSALWRGANGNCDNSERSTQ
jgi:hypothetical protein